MPGDHSLWVSSPRRAQGHPQFGAPVQGKGPQSTIDPCDIEQSR